MGLMKINKRGYQLLSAYWFVILAIIAGAIISGALLFYSNVADVRGSEADILSGKIIDCVIKGGIVNQEFVDGNFDILQECKINFEEGLPEFADEEQYYIQLKILNFDTGVEIRKQEIGRIDFEQKCLDQELKGKIEKTFPQCKRKSVYSIDSQGSKYLIKVLTAVRKTEKNV